MSPTEPAGPPAEPDLVVSLRQSVADLTSEIARLGDVVRDRDVRIRILEAEVAVAGKELALLSAFVERAQRLVEADTASHAARIVAATTPRPARQQ